MVKVQKLQLVLLLCLLSLNTVVNAVEKIEIQGLFSNKAVIMIDGKMHILAVGQTSPEGVKVVSATSRGAVLEIDGQQQQYNLGNAGTVSTTYTKKKTHIETIYKDSKGMYMTHGNINGRSAHFLVDTGASAIAMNTEQAEQLDIPYERIGRPANISTASEFKKGYSVQLKTVTVGDITEKNVEALIIEGGHPGPILLGMSFLSRLDINHRGTAMTLLQK